SVLESSIFTLCGFFVVDVGVGNGFGFTGAADLVGSKGAASLPTPHPPASNPASSLISSPSSFFSSSPSSFLLTSTKNLPPPTSTPSSSSSAVESPYS